MGFAGHWERQGILKEWLLFSNRKKLTFLKPASSKTRTWSKMKHAISRNYIQYSAMHHLFMPMTSYKRTRAK
jgi:hypothetical protein